MNTDSPWPFVIGVVLAIALFTGGLAQCDKQANETMRECLKAKASPLECRTAIGQVR